MNVLILKSAPTAGQLVDLLEPVGDFIKLAVDIQRGVLAAGGIMHADCEEVLLAEVVDRKIFGAPIGFQISARSVSNRSSISGHDTITSDSKSRTLHGALGSSRSSGTFSRGGERVDEQLLRQRYLRDDWPIRLGNLASTLARASATATNPRAWSITTSALREGMLMMEWNLQSAPTEILIQLAPLQAELALWKRGWEALTHSPALQTLLARRTREMSDKILQLSGLLDKSAT